MRILQKTEYGLRAVLDLAAQPSERLVKACEIAYRQDIPNKYLEFVLATLRDGGLVESRRGALGGYRLALPPERITVGQVLVLLGDPSEIARQRRDGLTGMWDRVDAAISSIVFATTFAELIRRGSEFEIESQPLQRIETEAQLVS